jgi:serine/threonine kinase PknH
MNAVPPNLSNAPAGLAGKTRLWLGAIALVALTALGALCTALGGRPTSAGPSAITIREVDTSTTSNTSAPSSATGETPSTTTSAPTTTPTTSALDKLHSVLPPGYNASNCGPSNDPTPSALATVDCGQPDGAGGPTSARFSLFADTNALASQFQDAVNGDEVSKCPGSIDSPRSWHYEATPAFDAGTLVCGTHNNMPDLMWTKNDVLLLGDVQGPDLSTLYGWWLSLG